MSISRRTFLGSIVGFSSGMAPVVLPQEKMFMEILTPNERGVLGYDIRWKVFGGKNYEEGRALPDAIFRIDNTGIEDGFALWYRKIWPVPYGEIKAQWSIKYLWDSQLHLRTGNLPEFVSPPARREY